MLKNVRRPRSKLVECSERSERVELNPVLTKVPLLVHVTLFERLEGVEPVEPGHYAVIKVEDSGCGIPEEDLQRVLEPFFSFEAQSATAGTSPSLAIVHQIVSHNEP